MATTSKLHRTSGGFGFSFMAPLVVSASLNPINSSTLSIALVSINHDFPDDPTATGWLIASLYLAAAVAQPVLGQMGDIFGPRRILLFGAAIVGAGGLAGGLAQTIALLIFSRVLIGIGTSAGYPCSIALIRERAGKLGVVAPAKTLALLSIAGSASTSLGPPLGGLIVALLGWRYVCFINLPLALAGIILSLTLLPVDSPVKLRKWREIDLIGIILFTGGMICLMLFLMALSHNFMLFALVGAFIFFCAFVFWERAHPLPFIAVRMLAQNHELSVTYVRQFITSIIIYTVFYSLPQWMQISNHLSPAVSGLLMLPIAIFSAIASFAVARDNSNKAAKVTGSLTLIASCLLLLWFDKSVELISILLLTTLFGISNGALGMVNQQGLLQHAPSGYIGIASGLLRTAQYCGAILAAVIAALVIGNPADGSSFHRLAWILLVIGGVLVALLAYGEKRQLTKT